MQRPSPLELAVLGEKVLLDRLCRVFDHPALPVELAPLVIQHLPAIVHFLLVDDVLILDELGAVLFVDGF